jgi:hypothetical protein
MTNLEIVKKCNESLNTKFKRIEQTPNNKVAGRGYEIVYFKDLELSFHGSFFNGDIYAYYNGIVYILS